MRKTQERTEITRTKLVNAGILLFCERGFNGVSIRDLETAAGVKRNLLTYHFGDKDTLWKASADAIYFEMNTEVDRRLSMINERSSREILEYLIRFLVYFLASNTKVNRLVSHEFVSSPSWRTDYLIEQHTRPAADTLEILVHDATGLDHDSFIHWYYIMIASTSSFFSSSAHTQLLFGVDPCEENRVEAHADMVVSMLLKGAQIMSSTPTPATHHE